VSQNGDRAEVLAEIAKYFSCGTIRPDPSDPTLKWETRSLTGISGRECSLTSRITRSFQEMQRDLDFFMEICSLLAQGKHLSADGLRTIVELAARMNPSGRRRYDPDFILENFPKVKA
jgi:hypothetical protein